MNKSSSDPHNLKRFVDAQSESYQLALSELLAGKKRSHWIWYIFPQVAGLGSSPMAQSYAIRSREEAQAFLAHPALGPRIRECAAALLSVADRSAEQIMGYPDYLKLQSSMTLFGRVFDSGSVFHRVLHKYFDGMEDPRTLRFLEDDAKPI